MDDYTPTDDVVKDAACFPRRRLGEPRDIDPDAYDRWLAARDADHEKALRERIAQDIDHVANWTPWQEDGLRRAARIAREGVAP